MRRRVDKLLAKQALEALSEAWKHYQRWSLRLEQTGAERPAQLLDEYVRLRRIRDYLDNLVAQPGVAVIELEENDANLFVSCMIYAAEDVENLLLEGGLEPDHERWYQEKLRNLADLAQAFATEDVKLLGGREVTGSLPAHCQSVVSAISSRLQSQRSAQATSRIGPAARPSSESGTAPPSGIIKGDSFATDFAQKNWGGQRNLLPSGRGGSRDPEESGFEASYLKPVREPKSSEGWGRRSGLGLSDPGADFADEGPQDQDFAKPRQTPPDASTPTISRGSSLISLELSLVREPRLRSILGIDLPALDRAYGAQDFRTAAIHLGSIFEALVVDIGIQRRSKLELSGTPDSWRLQALAPKLVGGRFSGPERTALHGLIQAKHLIRPAVQLTNPMPITRAAVDKMLDFVRRFVRECGLSGT